jgi:hypothetical protein
VITIKRFSLDVSHLPFLPPLLPQKKPFLETCDQEMEEKREGKSFVEYFFSNMASGMCVL